MRRLLRRSEMGEQFGEKLLGVGVDTVTPEPGAHVEHVAVQEVDPCRLAAMSTACGKSMNHTSPCHHSRL